MVWVLGERVGEDVGLDSGELAGLEFLDERIDIGEDVSIHDHLRVFGIRQLRIDGQVEARTAGADERPDAPDPRIADDALFNPAHEC